MSQLRVLGRLRLSRETAASTSLKRQEEIVQRWADDNDAVVAGWAIDGGVSGKINPFETPDLGPWLKPPKMHEWDALVAWKWDRISRGGQSDKQKVLDWTKANGKFLVTVEERINTQAMDPFTEIMLAFIASSAQQERESMVERQISSQRKLRQSGRFRGGVIPYGFETYQSNGGHYLQENPEQAEIVREIVDRVLRGETVNAICVDLTRRGVATKKNRGRWGGPTIGQMLRSRSLLGQQVHKGAVVRGEDGNPIQFSLPLISQQRWHQLQERLAQGTARVGGIKGAPRGGHRPLLGILFCECGAKMYYQRVRHSDGNVHEYWRCRATRLPKVQRTCHEPAAPAKVIERVIMDVIRASIGHERATEERFLPPEGNQEQQLAVRENIDTLKAEKRAGLYDRDLDQYEQEMRSLVGQLRQLEGVPSKPARYERVELPETWGQLLADAVDDPAKMRVLLHELHLRVTVSRAVDREIVLTITTDYMQLREVIPTALTEPVELPYPMQDGEPAVVVI